MRDRRSVDPPRWRRVLSHPLTLLVGAVVVAGAALWLLASGRLPVLGYAFGPLAVGAAGTAVLLLRHPSGRRQGLAGEQALRHLRGVVPALAAEQAARPPERASGATDDELAAAAEQAGLAVQRFAWGDYAGAVPHLDALGATGRGWHRAAPLTERLHDLGRATDRLRDSGPRTSGEGGRVGGP